MEGKGLGGKVLAEILGTFVLVLMGDGVVANVALAPRLAPQAYDWVAIALGWGLGVAVAVYIAAGVSGAHLNPAVTVALAVKGDFPWRHVIPYVAAQMSGAFLGALGVYLAYYDGLRAAGMPNVWCTGPGSVYAQAFWGSGSSYPIGSYSFANAFITEILGTMTLVMGVLAITDRRNAGAGANMAPLVIGLLVVGIGLSLGGPTGYAINPARDLGPRIFGALVGTPGLFSTPYWIGPPVAGTIAGGILGALLYRHAIAPHLPRA